MAKFFAFTATLLAWILVSFVVTASSYSHQNHSVKKYRSVESVITTSSQQITNNLGKGSHEEVARTHTHTRNNINESFEQLIVDLRGGSILAGWNPLGYAITSLGLQFLEFEGSLDSDVGRFLATFKSGRKRQSVVKQQWLEIVRVSKKGQSMRIYRTLDDLFAFCVSAGFLS